MSALRLPAATWIGLLHVCSGPTADSCSAEGSLFNHLVGAAAQRRRDIDAERLDLREHRNATGLQPGGLQWVVISGHR